MPTTDRRLDRARRASASMLAGAGAELRLARTGAGLSQRDVAGAAGLSHSTVSRIEGARSPDVSLSTLARVATVVGLDLSLRFYPGGDPIWDTAHVRLLARLRERIHPDLRWRTEVPLPIPGDRRAWDAVIEGREFTCAVEAETRIRDAQAVARRVNLKQRDGELDHVILLVADTRANRIALRGATPELAGAFPTSQRDALRALAAGHAPAGNAIIIL